MSYYGMAMQPDCLQYTMEEQLSSYLKQVVCVR